MSREDLTPRQQRVYDYLDKEMPHRDEWDADSNLESVVKIITDSKSEWTVLRYYAPGEMYGKRYSV